MTPEIVIPTRQLTYTQQQLQDWKAGRRDDCPEGYCKCLPGTYGFGEYIVGQYFSCQGYQWIHHDFNIFGGNKSGKYPEAEEIIKMCVGQEKFEKVRSFYPTFAPLEEPDLLIFRPDFSEMRFAEAKRVDTRDNIRESQVRGLLLLSVLLNCKVELFEVVSDQKLHVTESLHWKLTDY